MIIMDYNNNIYNNFINNNINYKNKICNILIANINQSVKLFDGYEKRKFNVINLIY